MAEYKQVKISVPIDLAESFKSACEMASVSMAAELSKFMADQTGLLRDAATKQTSKNSIETRAKRRRQLNIIILQLKTIRDREDAYRAKIPENLQSGSAYEDAEQSVDTMDQAIELLKEAY